ncbi:hypothetical protein R6V09_00540 [Streptomyces sp. W16]|uniref:hypothetical protein n=1 Tax=Streptomyces sp. W16 TaxID=3076631 RepID=UPI00295BE980|nr:hypothetical protein [Streptomyces sp. W16]MDV9168631.1 hypothetical protein [Streptomyces sp. W16]
MQRIQAETTGLSFHFHQPFGDCTRGTQVEKTWADPSTRRLLRGHARVVVTGDDLHLLPQNQPIYMDRLPAMTTAGQNLFELLHCREWAAAGVKVIAEHLVLPRSQRWDEAIETALIGTWSNPLWDTGRLAPTALGVLKAEVRTLHRQLVPLFRRRTRHGRVLSLDAELCDGLSLHDLVAADVDLLHRAEGGVFADEKLNRVFMGLKADEQQVVLAYAYGEGTTWTEAAAAADAADPVAVGERVRRKTKRLAAEQARRTALRRG